MATDKNVFGLPVTQGSRVERAEKAYNNQNEGEKRDNAVAFLRQEKKDYGVGSSTLCLFYNATGEELNYAFQHSIYGKIYKSYPTRIQNGQWGAFLHVKKPAVASGSVGYVVYRGKKNDTDYCKFLLGWDTPWSSTQNNHTYCDIFDDGSVDDANVYEKMEASGRQKVALKLGMHVTTDIEEGSSPLFQAMLNIEH